MEPKEIITRLEIIKLAASVNDHNTITIQTNHLKRANSSRLDEISTLLNSKNYKQGLYLIKAYLSEMGNVDALDSFTNDGETERVLDIEDMLRMSPLAKEAIRDYRRSIYTKDDLEAFARNIEFTPNKESESFNNFEDDLDKNIEVKVDETIKESEKEKFEQEKIEVNYNEDVTSKLEDTQELSEDKSSNFVESLEEELKEPKEIKSVQKQELTPEELEESKKIAKAMESVDSETPLDEISAEVIDNTTKNKRAKVLSKYKNLREKFAKKVVKNNKKSVTSINSALTKAKEVATNIVSKSEKIESEINKDKNQEDFNNIQEKSNNVKVQESMKEQKVQSKLSKEKHMAQEELDKEIIYASIPHIEEKFRQAFILYPPVKENEIWVEEVVRFLKHISKNSFTELDVKQLLDEYNYYLDKRDIAKAAQVLLLASSTDSKFAKFLLARELFSGKVIVRDLKKSFKLMKELANTFYPEAVCDLGQFYEYGIGVPKDKKIALKLYEKAFELGVARATRHINRLKESGGFLSAIFKLK